jgi:hypothetical protein
VTFTAFREGNTAASSGRHPGFELSKVVRVHAREPKRGRQQAGRFRHQIRARVVAPRTIVTGRRNGSVSSLNSCSMTSKCAEFALVAFQNTSGLRYRKRPRRNAQQQADQPRARDTIHLRPASGSPTRSGRAHPAPVGLLREPWAVSAPDSAGDQTRIAREVLVRADINNRWSTGDADEAGEFFDGNGVDRRHGARPCDEALDAILKLSPREEIASP